MSSDHPYDRPLELKELETLMAVRDIWCQGQGIAETDGAYLQVLMDLIDGYQSGIREADQMFVRLQLLAIGTARP
ncbi:hypothetical protein [Rhizobium sp. Leaf341]|uniref:hypothetical protein n=1 Tax=Rhizobium sp. Leaf341 TaxID=1736344 RepID=UPI0012E3E3D7|nr:hypothetical protein [Rhizobium sp. Leaf341]